MVAQQTASMEDYLEAIAVLGEGEDGVRVTQLSEALGVKKSSVTSALKKLSREGLVEHEKYGQVVLTADGGRIARDVFRRHEALRLFLVEVLNVEPEIASEDACKMEHFVSPASLERLAKFVEFVLARPGGKVEWLRGFDHYFKHGKASREYAARHSKEG